MTRMSEAEYAAYRRRAAAMFALRIACAGVIIYVWDDLDSIQKAVAIALAIVVVPGFTTAKRLFVPYRWYLEEGIPGATEPR